MANYKVYKNTETKGGTLAVSDTSTYYSDAITVDGEAVSWHIVWAGTPNGTFTLWYSNKPDAAVATDTDWVQDTSFPATAPAGSASKVFISASQTTALRARLKYVNASSTGTIEAWAQTAMGRS